MSTLKIRIKIADHEFEADGPPETVEEQVLVFAKLIGRAEQQKAAPAASDPQPRPIDGIARVDGRVVSLSVQPESLQNAVLVLLLGQHELRGNGAVAGAEIMAGLRKSGFKVNRADHILKRHAMTGHIVTTGKRRLRRYRLTTDGVVKARKIAQALVTAPPK